MKEKEKVARPGRLELPTLCFEGRRSIQLSYGRSLPNFSYYNCLRYNLLCLPFFRYGCCALLQHRDTYCCVVFGKPFLG